MYIISRNSFTIRRPSLIARACACASSVASVARPASHCARTSASVLARVFASAIARVARNASRYSPRAAAARINHWNSRAGVSVLRANQSRAMMIRRHS